MISQRFGMTSGNLSRKSDVRNSGKLFSRANQRYVSITDYISRILFDNIVRLQIICSEMICIAIYKLLSKYQDSVENLPKNRRRQLLFAKIIRRSLYSFLSLFCLSLSLILSLFLSPLSSPLLVHSFARSLPC